MSITTAITVDKGDVISHDKRGGKVFEVGRCTHEIANVHITFESGIIWCILAQQEVVRVAREARQSPHPAAITHTTTKPRETFSIPMTVRASRNMRQEAKQARRVLGRI